MTPLEKLMEELERKPKRLGFERLDWGSSIAQQSQQSLGGKIDHQARKAQATAFDEESTLPIIIPRFLEIIHGNVSFQPYPKPPGISLFPLAPRDKDSVWRNIDWNDRKGQWYGTDYVLDYFAIETCPDGTMHFNYGLFGHKAIQEEKWRVNKNPIEEALYKAYHHPKRRGYNDSHTSSSQHYTHN